MSSTIKNEIERKLVAAFSPKYLEVVNESARHAGHRRDDGQTYDGLGETHFRIIIRSKAFEDMKSVEIHRAINHVLREELAGIIHALAIEASG